jgi:hypothetical protein
MTGSVVVVGWGEGRDGLPSECEEVLTLVRELGASLGAELHWRWWERSRRVPPRWRKLRGSERRPARRSKLAGFAADPCRGTAQYCAQQPSRAVIFPRPSTRGSSLLVWPDASGRPW